MKIIVKPEESFSTPIRLVDTQLSVLSYIDKEEAHICCVYNESDDEHLRAYLLIATIQSTILALQELEKNGLCANHRELLPLFDKILSFCDKIDFSYNPKEENE